MTRTRRLAHAEVNKLLIHKASGKHTQRPQLEAILSFVREGDTIVVHSMNCLARNLDDLRRLMQKLAKRGLSMERMKIFRLVVQDFRRIPVAALFNIRRSALLVIGNVGMMREEWLRCARASRRSKDQDAEPPTYV
ncbi:hypothetical protein PCPL58_3699 [Pseudomonas cerasi]|uniref:Resolvase/invertase-type recombinase catalytic domain-containing protein n=1 Tax=Pseudomonas cerasi TaxID=1583341 RepID=A0A193SSZ8_9PSED|nr:hypothetical protein PCPL58_3699 [Pseudomonas cerasi]SOS21876.1 hypothetical protein PL963_03789 [Pseudomonas cerasi]